jgi:hypothetical protein
MLLKEMRRHPGLTGLAVVTFVLGSLALAQAQSRNNVSNAWGGVYKNRSVEEGYLLGNQALIEWQLRRGGNAGGGGGSTHIYNGPVTNNCNSCSSSGSTVMNVHNLNEVHTDITATGGSTVVVDTKTTQDAKGAQSGAANANAATGNNATQSGSAINQ